MDEVFVEQIIKRRPSLSIMMLRTVSIVIVPIIFLLLLRYGIFAFTVTALVIYGVYMIWVYTSIEYEYSFLNGELSIDKIMGQRKRKHVADYEMKEAEVVAPLTSDQIVRASTGAMIKDYSSGFKSNRLYAMIVNSADGKVKVVFEPSEKVIDAMYHMRPNIVKKNI